VKQCTLIKSRDRKCVLKFKSIEGNMVYNERQVTSAVSRAPN